MKEAAITSVFWIGAALLFNGFVLLHRGADHAALFLTAYVVEKSLSVDNLFVFYVLFRHFRVRSEDEHTLLFCGVLGAIVMRAILIWLGVRVIEQFHAVIYLFGAFLVWTGVMLAKSHDDDVSHGKMITFLSRVLPVARADARGFVVKEDGRWKVTAYVFALVAIEATDLAFAVDSIPAVIGITPDFFTAYTSNIFAILGLRALYFLLAGMIRRFQRLKYGLCAVLVFIGAKMLVADFVHVPTSLSLVIILVILGGIIAADLLRPAKREIL